MTRILSENLNRNFMNTNTKQDAYNKLVEKRKQYDFEKIGLINPSKYPNYDCDHLNPWGQWHGNLAANILLIGQDFSDEKYFVESQGKTDKDNPTNQKLSELFQELNININEKSPRVKLYFTNAMLGLKSDGMAAKIKKSDWYKATANEFIKPLIDIIQPKIIITMGKPAYLTLATIFGLPNGSLESIVQQKQPINLLEKQQGSQLLFPVYHCSQLGLRNRPDKKQKEDWARIKPFL